MTTVQFNRYTKNNMWFGVFAFALALVIFPYHELLAAIFQIIGWLSFTNMVYFVFSNKDTLNDNEEVPE